MTVRARDLLELFHTLQILKQTKRTGWLDRGIPHNETESVADHSFMTALMAWIIALDDPDLDADRVLKLAVIHDIAEAIVGDMPPYTPQDIPDRSDIEALRSFFSVRHLRTPENKASKKRAEAEAATRLFGLMPDTASAEISALWNEYEQRSTPEARFVKDIDNLEAFLQSRAYLRDHPDAPVWGFLDMALKEIEHPAPREVRDEELDE